MQSVVGLRFQQRIPVNRAPEGSHGGGAGVARACDVVGGVAYVEGVGGGSVQQRQRVPKAGGMGLVGMGAGLKCSAVHQIGDAGLGELGIAEGSALVGEDANGDALSFQHPQQAGDAGVKAVAVGRQGVVVSQIGGLDGGDFVLAIGAAAEKMQQMAQKGAMVIGGDSVRGGRGNAKGAGRLRHQEPVDVQAVPEG